MQNLNLCDGLVQFEKDVNAFTNTADLICSESEVDTWPWVMVFEDVLESTRAWKPEAYDLVSQYPRWSSTFAIRAILILLRPPCDASLVNVSKKLIMRFVPADSYECFGQLNDETYGWRSMAHYIAFIVGSAVGRKEDIDFSFWASIIRRTVKAGIGLQLKESFGDGKTWKTPMARYMKEFLTHSLWNWYHGVRRYRTWTPLTLPERRRIDIGLRVWIKLLDMAGVDLPAYGKAESNALKQLQYGAHQEDLRHRPNFRAWILDIRHIVSGPRPCDWHFEYISQCDDLAEDFWSLVNRPLSRENLVAKVISIKHEVERSRQNSARETVPPGAWIEDRRKYEKCCYNVRRFCYLESNQYSEVVRMVEERPMEEVYELLDLGSCELRCCARSGGCKYCDPWRAVYDYEGDSSSDSE